MRLQAVEQLNLKAHNMRDLMTDEPFVRDDLVTLQDPTDLNKFNMTTFHHLKNSLTVGEEGECVCVCVCSAASASLSLPEEEQAKREPTYYLNALNPETRATLEQLSRDAKLQVAPSGLSVPCLSSRVPAGGVNVSLFLQEKKPAESKSKGKEKATSRTAVSLRLLHCSTHCLNPLPPGPLLHWGSGLRLHVHRNSSRHRERGSCP